MRDKYRIKQQIPKTQLELACLLPWAQGNMRLSVPSIERLRGSVVPQEQSIVGNEQGIEAVLLHPQAITSCFLSLYPIVCPCDWIKLSVVLHVWLHFLIVTFSRFMDIIARTRTAIFFMAK